MSKSFGRYKKLGNCYGSNTQFYRDRRHSYRALLKANINKAMSDQDFINTFDDVYVHPEKEKKFHDTWSEPTDGGWRITAKDVKEMYDSGEYIRRRGIYRVKRKNRVKK